MDSSDFRSPRKELQGPRPTPLKLSKASRKIRKPSVAPPPQKHSQQQPQPPVIIYSVSPKVIHTHSSEFMKLVQRLTGSSSSSSAMCGKDNPFNDDCGAVSPAAKYAVIEKANKSPEGKKKVSDVGFEEIGGDALMERTSKSLPSILSPGPASLQQIAPSSLSAPSDSNSIGSFFYDLSPAIHGNTSFSMPSTSQSSFFSPHLTSPYVDLFNNIFDL